MPPEKEQTIFNDNDATKASPKRRKKLLFIGLVLISLVVVGASLYIYKINNNALVVGNIKISKTYYDQLSSQAKASGADEFTTDKGIKDYIADTLKLRLAAQKFGFSASQTDIDELANSYTDASTKDKPNDWQKLVAENAVYQVNILHIKNGDKRMARLVFPFSRLFAYNPESPANSYGTPEQIKVEQEYAVAQAKLAREQITKDSSEQNVQTIVNNIIKDDRLSYSFTGNTSRVFYYNKDQATMYYSAAQTQAVGDQKLKDLLNNLNSGISETITENTYKGFSKVSGYESAGLPFAYLFYASIANPDPMPSINNDISEYTKIIKVQGNE